MAADAAGQRKSYRRELGKNNLYERLGVLAPWRADEYLLGREDRCKQVLARALAHGLLNGCQGGRAGVDLFFAKLAARGYDRP